MGKKTHHQAPPAMFADVKAAMERLVGCPNFLPSFKRLKVKARLFAHAAEILITSGKW